MIDPSFNLNHFDDNIIKEHDKEYLKDRIKSIIITDTQILLDTQFKPFAV